MQLQLWLIFTILFFESFISLKEKKEKWLFRYVVGGPKKQQNLFLHASHVNCNGQGLIKAHIHTQMGYIKSRV